MNYKFAPLAVAVAAVLGLGWLAANPNGNESAPVTRSIPGIPTAQHVIFISCDGLRGDFLAYLITNRPLSFPNFKRLKEGGAFTFNARTDYKYSETIPDHCCMVTGRPVKEPGSDNATGVVGHGFIWNTGAEVTNTLFTIHKPSGATVVNYKSSVFDVVHDSGSGATALKTAFFHSKDRMALIDRSYNSANGAASPNGTNKIDRRSGVVTGSTSSTNVMAEFTNDLNSNPLAAYTFLHFVDPDKAGHASSWIRTTPPAAMSTWETAVATCDASLGTLFTWLDNHPAEKATTSIILTADHGGGNPANNHIDSTKVENYTIPFFIYGPGFKGGSDAYQYFSNRSNPNTARIDDVVANPPIRNGDAANLSLTLLGLPNIPGSYFKPLLINPDTTSILNITPISGGLHEVKWPLSATSYRLETTTNLQAGPWTLVSANLTTTVDSNIHTFTPTATKAFFRLKKI